MNASLALVATLFLLTGLSDAALAQSVTRGPYLQLGTPSSVVVKWRTDQATDSVVTYGTSVASQNLAANGSTSTTEHEVELTNLSPDTEYFYSVGSSTGVLAGGNASYSFSTAPVAGSSVSTRIWVLGDSGLGNANAAAVRDAFEDFTGSRRPDLWLMLGDNAYTDGKDDEYQDAVFDMYPETLRQAVLWSTLGNHDGHSADSATESGPYYDIFTFPANAEAGGIPSGTEAYYSFDYANIHFISLDSYDTARSPDGAMMTWLENDLAATTSDWAIAFWHHPPYSKGSHNSDTDSRMREMRTNALPILESYGVDLVMSGHSHSYERSVLIDSHYGTSDTFDTSMKVDDGSGRDDDTGPYEKFGGIGAPHQGAVYAVAGSSAQISGGALNHPAMYVSLNTLGSMVLDVDGGRLDAYFVDASGATRDYFTIAKEVDPPPDTEAPSVPANLQVTAVTETTVSLQWSASTDNVGITGYRVIRDGQLVGTPSGTSYQDSGLASGTEFVYVVVARDAEGNQSAQSASLTITTDAVIMTDDQPPSVPGNVFFASVTDTTVSLQWDMATDNIAIDGYRVSRNGTVVGFPAGTSFQDSGLTPGAEYTYAVSAVDTSGNESAQSAPLTTRTNLPPVTDTESPTTPTNVHTTFVTETAVSLQWNAAADNVGVTGYKVARDGQEIATPTATGFQDSNLAPGTEYAYIVSAFDAAGNQSASSTSLVVTTMTPVVIQPVVVSDETSGGGGLGVGSIGLLLLATLRRRAVLSSRCVRFGLPRVSVA